MSTGKQAKTRALTDNGEFRGGKLAWEGYDEETDRGEWLKSSQPTALREET